MSNFFVERPQEFAEIAKYLSDRELFQLTQVYPKLLDNSTFWSARFQSSTQRTLSKFRCLSMGESYFARMAMINDTTIYEVGYLKIIKYILETLMLTPTTNQINHAAIYGPIDVVKYLFGKGLIPDQYGINQTARKGRIDIIEYLSNSIQPNEYGANMAVSNGYYDLVKYLAERFEVYPNIDGLNDAVETGNFTAVKYYIQHYDMSPEISSVDMAAEYGKFDIIRYLNEKLNILPSEDGLEGAVGTGQMDLVKYLVDRGMIPNDRGAFFAARNGYLDMVRYLLEDLKMTLSDSIINAGTDTGQIEVIRYLVSKGFKPTVYTANLAACRAQDEVVQYLIENFGIRPNIDGANLAARRRHAEVIRYCVEELGFTLQENKFVSH